MKSVSVRRYLRRRDPYSVLGVRRGATPQEIRSKYLALVKQLHPDITGGDVQKQERLKEVNVAYEEIEQKPARPTVIDWWATEEELMRPTPVDTSPAMLKTLRAKLNPKRFPGMSPQMAAVVGFILGKHYTDPYITSLSVTSDGFLLGRDTQHGSIFVGSVSDLVSNLGKLANAAQLTRVEAKTLQAVAEERIAGLNMEWEFEE